METTKTVTTPEECIAYVNQVGICSWRRMANLPSFPSLEEATPWSGMEMTLKTWFWKDDLHIEKRLYYGKLLGAESPAFVSREWLPVFIAAQGDNDPRTLYEKGQLSQMAFGLYEHIERNGPTPASHLPWRPGSRQMHLAALERRFIITKHALTGRTRGTYGYLWGRADDFFPDAFAAASRLPVPAARAEIRERLAAQGVPLSPSEAAKLFRWTEE